MGRPSDSVVVMAPALLLFTPNPRLLRPTLVVRTAQLKSVASRSAGSKSRYVLSLVIPPSLTLPLVITTAGPSLNVTLTV